jgi:TatD DNase family protein
LKTLAVEARDSGHAVAFGEIGLDYDRLFLAPKGTQLKYFDAQLDLATELQMPLFLHSRACSADFERLLDSRLDRLPKRGLVHSFTGTVEEMQRLVAMGFDIGINGCSMKTEENVSVVKEVPLDRLQIETDGPWVSKHGLVDGRSIRLIFTVRDESFPCFFKIYGGSSETFDESGKEREMAERSDGQG